MSGAISLFAQYLGIYLKRWELLPMFLSACFCQQQYEKLYAPVPCLVFSLTSGKVLKILR